MLESLSSKTTAIVDEKRLARRGCLVPRPQSFSSRQKVLMFVDRGQGLIARSQRWSGHTDVSRPPVSHDLSCLSTLVWVMSAARGTKCCYRAMASARCLSLPSTMFRTVSPVKPRKVCITRKECVGRAVGIASLNWSSKLVPIASSPNLVPHTFRLDNTQTWSPAWSYNGETAAFAE